MSKTQSAKLWSVLLPDERLKRAVSPNYRVTTKDGSVKEVEITDTRLLVILKAKGWTFERIEK